MEEIKKMVNKSDSFSGGYYIFIIVAVLSFIVYANAVINGFVIDDMSQVVNNHWIRDFKFIPEIFTSGVWSFEGRDSNYYRPLMYILYMGVYHIVGLKPWGYHFLNVLLNTANTILVLLVGHHLFGKREIPFPYRTVSPAVVAAALFATHPLHTEAVAWVAGILDLSFTGFFLLSFYLYMRSGQSYNTAFVLSAASFFLATLCKEPALTLPAILVVYDYMFSRDPIRLRDAWKRYIPFLSVCVIYLIMRYRALGGIAPVKVPVQMDIYQYVINIVVLLGDYLEKLLFPVNLNIWHVFHPISSILTVQGVVALIILGGFLVLFWVSVKKDRVVFLGLTLIVLPLLPVLYIPALTQGSENAFAERYLYLPSFGFVLLAASCVESLVRRKPIWSPYVASGILAILLLYSAGTVRRNFDWKDSYTLWSDAVKKSPMSGRAHENLGYALFYKGQQEQGLEQLRYALRLKPDLFNEKLDKGIHYASKGFLDKAIFNFNIAILFKPDSLIAHYNLGIAYDEKGWIDEAIEQYEIVLMINPKYLDAYNNLGIAYSKKGSLDKAIKCFGEALRIDPNDFSIRYNLAKTFEMRGQTDKAEEQRRIAKSLENNRK